MGSGAWRGAEQDIGAICAPNCLTLEFCPWRADLNSILWPSLPLGLPPPLGQLYFQDKANFIQKTEAANGRPARLCDGCCAGKKETAVWGIPKSKHQLSGPELKFPSSGLLRDCQSPYRQTTLKFPSLYIAPERDCHKTVNHLKGQLFTQLQCLFSWQLFAVEWIAIVTCDLLCIALNHSCGAMHLSKTVIYLLNFLLVCCNPHWMVPLASCYLCPVKDQLPCICNLIRLPSSYAIVFPCTEVSNT